VSWTDTSGNFWLFGGIGGDSTGCCAGTLNDLWEFGAGQWTWVSGSNLASQSGAWGVLGTPAPTNVPSARDSAQTWIDPYGNLWLFGGNGTDSTGATGQLNDLWVYEQ